MMELQLSLDFDCCSCEGPVGVTLKCAGKGLASRHAVGAAAVACPHCGALNQVCFDPAGRVRGVMPSVAECYPEPSLN